MFEKHWSFINQISDTWYKLETEFTSLLKVQLALNSVVKLI